MNQTLINPDLDLAALAERFAAHGRIQIDGFLREAVAHDALAALKHDVEWAFALRVGDEDRLYSHAEWEAIPLAERQALLRTANRQASGAFQYMFDYYPLLSSYHARDGARRRIDAMAELIESPAFLDFVRRVTGSSEITQADGQATRYRAGQYLTYHDDHFRRERRFAYVLNLTEAWHADWGGLLLFHDGRGNVQEGWLPRFNCLNLFAVPAGHSVSFVTPFAAAYRYSITGWLSVADPEGATR